MLYLGMTLSPPLWLGFALRYTGLGSDIIKHGRQFLLAIPGGIAFLLGVTNESHHLIWTSLSLADKQPAPLVINYGPGFWVATAIAYGLIFAGFVVYIAAYLESDKARRIKTGVMLAGSLLTLAVNIGFLFMKNDLNIDPTPLSFAISAPLLAFGYFRFGVLELFPLAASLVVENLQDAVIVVNTENRITNINRAAMELFELPNIGKDTFVFSILPQANAIREIWNSPERSIQLEVRKEAKPRNFEVRVKPIYADDNPNIIGRVIDFHDITIEQNLLKAEKRRSQHLSLLEEAGRRIADSLEETEILERAVDVITQKLGYAETAISVLRDNMMEIAVISGTDDFRYKTGYQQKIGTGIIGYTADLKETYVSNNVSEDPHYYSTSTKSGSVICTPILKMGKLFGVLYVESFELNAFDELDVITMETLASQISGSLHRADLHTQTQNDLRTLAIIQNISKLVTSSLDLDYISQTVVKSLKDAFGYTHVSIYFLRDDYLHLAAQLGYPEELIIQKIHISQGVIGKTYRTRAVQFIEDITEEAIFLSADHDITSEICVPLLKEDKVLGILNVESNQHNRLTQKDVDLLTTIAGPIAVSVDNGWLHTKILRMATTDAVTGLANRHVFEQALNAEIERSERHNSPLSLIIFDLDYFKQFNDQWGHPAGDLRLKAIADIIKHNLRKYDIAARYGGDEFAIILTDCTQQNALQFAERLRQNAQTGAPQVPLDGVGISGYTLSIGIASYPQDAAFPSELLIAADNAALRAKQQGRNRIKFAERS